MSRHRARLFAVIAAVVAGTTALVVLGQDRPELTTTSRQAYTLYLQGEERLNAFQFAAAESLLQEAVRLDGGFAMAHAALGEAFSSNGNSQAARRQIVLADSLARLLPREDERLLVQLRLPGNAGKAHAVRDSLLSLAQKRLPEHPLVLKAKALRFRDLGDAEGEEAAWRAVLRADPNYARAYNWLGYLAAGQGRYLEALSYLRRYAFLAPDIANPHDSLGEIYTYMGELDAAEQEYRQALQLQPEFYPSLLGLARVYLAQGRSAPGARGSRPDPRPVRGDRGGGRHRRLHGRPAVRSGLPAAGVGSARPAQRRPAEERRGGLDAQPRLRPPGASDRGAGAGRFAPERLARLAPLRRAGPGASACRVP